MKYIVILTILILNSSCKGQNNSLPIPKSADIFPGVQKDSKTNLYGILGNNLEISVPFEYEELSPSVSNFFIAKKNGKCGVIDSKNNVIHKFIYNHIYYTPPYLVGSIEKDNISTSCLIDTTNRILIPLNKGYNAIEIIPKYKENKFYFKAKNYGKNITDFYDDNGSLIRSFSYSSVDEYGKYLIIGLNDKKGIANLDGEIFLNPEFDHIDWIDENQACVYYDLNKPLAQVIDLSTKNVISNSYNTIRRREENGLMVVSKSIEGKKLYGIISSDYKEILPLCDCSIEYHTNKEHFEVTNNKSKEIKLLTLGDLVKK
jgi:hypothetical protein